MRHLSVAFVLALIIIPANAQASPGPPPPEFVGKAKVILIDPHWDAASAAPLFGDDVVVTENGAVVATGAAAWLSWRKRENGAYKGLVLGAAEGWNRNAPNGGELLIVDTFDDVDHSNPHIFMDSRYKTRSTLYVFGADHLIHAVHMFRVEGLWQESTR